MATVSTPSSPAEQRVVLQNVAWETYERLLADHLDSSVPRFTYDRGVLEIVSPSTEHEETNRTLATLVEVVAEELAINVRNVGSMTFRRRDIKRGFEPDSCFYIQRFAQVRGRVEIDPDIDPPPDLLIEIDVSNQSLDRFPIYAQMGVPEVWRYRRKRVSIHSLDVDDYHETGTSAALPPMTSEVLTRFVEASTRLDRIDWLRSLRAWARSKQTESRQAP
jgi:Uma2 family endonuclease